MEKSTFKAMVVTETPDKQFERQIAEKSVHELPAGDVLVNVEYSSLNYKDALSALVQSGYEVAGVSGKVADDGFLKNLGVKEIISREAAADTSGRPMLNERWAGVIDTVSGDILATAIKSTKLNGHITCCGNVASPNLPLTVFPFILRGVSLYGIDSQHCPMNTRAKIWEKFSREWKLTNLESLASEITLNELNEKIDRMLEGKSKGRTVIKL